MTQTPYYTSLFADPFLIKQVGAANILEGLPPTEELGVVLDGLEAGITGEAPDYLPEFQAEAQTLKGLLETGGSPADFMNTAVRAADVLRKMAPERQAAVLEATGWSQPRFLATETALQQAVRQTLGLVNTHGHHSLYYLARDLLPIQTITPGPNPRLDALKQSAEVVAHYLGTAGFQPVRILGEEGKPPSVYGEIRVDPNKPTVLLYAHHDVQPVSQEGWTTDPFQAFIRGGRLFGRGAADDKGGFMAGLSAVEAFPHLGVKLPVNVAYFVDGEEEIGSPNIAKPLAQLPDLQPDAILVLDSVNLEAGKPTIGSSTRGNIYCQVEIQTAAQTKHSGIHGEVADAFVAAASLLSNLDEVYDTGWISSPTAPPPNAAILIEAAQQHSMRVLAMEGTQPFDDTAGVTVPKVRMKLQFRIPPGGDFSDAVNEIRNKIISSGNETVQMTLLGTPTPPFQWDHDPYFPSITSRLQQALAIGYGEEASSYPMGLTIGALSVFQRRWPRAAIYPVGIEDPITNAHAENESLNIADFMATARSVAAFLLLLGQPQ